MELPSDEMLLANAISFLIEGQQVYEAGLLLLCDMETVDYDTSYDVTTVVVELVGSRAVYEIICGTNKRIRDTIQYAFNAITPRSFGVQAVTCRVQLTEFDSTWRTQLMNALQENEALNQGLPIKDAPRFPWENLYFRSPPEIAIAKALNEHDVFFLPNCMARFGSPLPKERMNKEADFLVCCDGKWGIIEVDGESYHRIAANDHERDRLFQNHRIRVIQRYTAKQCISEPQHVVQGFLNLLQKNG